MLFLKIQHWTRYKTMHRTPQIEVVRNCLSAENVPGWLQIITFATRDLIVWECWERATPLISKTDTDL